MNELLKKLGALLMEEQALTDNYTHAEKRLDMVKPIADISHLIVGEAEIIEDSEEPTECKRLQVKEMVE